MQKKTVWFLDFKQECRDNKISMNICFEHQNMHTIKSFRDNRLKSFLPNFYDFPYSPVLNEFPIQMQTSLHFLSCQHL